MELKQRLLVQAKQTITITPQVIQSIKLLKFGQEELLAYLREQEERNPLIEIICGPRDAAMSPIVEDERTMHDATQMGGSAAAPEGYAMGPDRGSTSFYAPGVRRNPSGGDLRGIEETCASSISLREHLLRQVELTIRDHVDRVIAIEIVESVDPDGYLRRDLDEIADNLAIGEEKVEAVLSQVQCFEPAGIAARNLAECLRLQLKETAQLSVAMSTLLDNLDLLRRYDVEGLSRRCAVDRREIAAMVGIVRELDPRPGRRFDSEPVMPALPDLNVNMRADGSFHIELNADLLPKVLVNREYYAEIRAGATGADDARFATDCMRNANWLTHNLDQRANTILKVATEIAVRQKDFFLHGAEHIKPLCQRDVAESLGLHRSTVCRATADKYMMTNRGMFELKFFFSNAINSADGEEEVSAESVRGRIRHLINAETANRVLSDDAIMRVLRNDGVDIARRTVAKYREMMHIPSSSIRKRRWRAVRYEVPACTA